MLSLLILWKLFRKLLTMLIIATKLNQKFFSYLWDWSVEVSSSFFWSKILVTNIDNLQNLLLRKWYLNSYEILGFRKRFSGGDTFSRFVLLSSSAVLSLEWFYRNQIRFSKSYLEEVQSWGLRNRFVAILFSTINLGFFQKLFGRNTTANYAPDLLCFHFPRLT